MTFNHRKSLENPENFAMKYASPCYMCYICPDDCTMYISPPPPPQPPPDKHQISTTLILMLCVLSAAFLFLSYLTICRYRPRRRNSMASSLENGNLRQDFIDENQRSVLDHHIWYIRTIGLQQTMIDSIPVFRYKDGEGLIEVRDCCVCLNEFKEDECLRLLPKCSHAFHLPCIDTWLRSHKNCPVCRAPVLINMDTNTGRVDSVETNTTRLGSREDNRTVINELETSQTGQTRGVAVIFRVLGDLTGHNKVPVGRDLKRVKRSLSLDFSSRSMICTKRDEGSSGIKMAIVEKRDFEMYNRLIKSSSHEHYVKKGPVLMKKSFSFSGKRSLRKHSRSLETISIPEISIQNRGS